jgi:hypothetical protein
MLHEIPLIPEQTASATTMVTAKSSPTAERPLMAERVSSNRRGPPITVPVRLAPPTR